MQPVAGSERGITTRCSGPAPAVAGVAGQRLGRAGPATERRSVMPQRELPTGIQRLLDRVTYSSSEPGYVHFRQDALRKWVGEIADSHEDGWALLRQCAIAQLTDDDAKAVDRALAILFVVGNASDAEAVKPLLSHAKTHLQKSARTCLFEIKRRPVEA